MHFHSSLGKTFFFISIFYMFFTAADGAPLHFDHVELNSLRAFFGDLRGNYIDPDTLLSTQIGEGLEIGLAASGKSISEMPSLKDGSFLDFGGVFQDRFDDKGAVILTLNGSIKAAALISVRCVWTDKTHKFWSCGDGSHTLTIFVRDKKEIKQAIDVFQAWANGVNEKKVPMNVILLHGYGNMLIN